MKHKQRLHALLLLLMVSISIAVMTSCNDDTDANNKPQETAISGTAEVLCDEQIIDLMKASKHLYDSVHPNAHLTLAPVDAESGMDAMMRHEARAIVIARDWLPSEDTIIQELENSLKAIPMKLAARTR